MKKLICVCAVLLLSAANVYALGRADREQSAYRTVETCVYK